MGAKRRVPGAASIARGRLLRTLFCGCLAAPLSIVWPSSSLDAQYSRPSGSYSLDRVPGGAVAGIRAALRSSKPPWNAILRSFFGPNGYDQGIPDLVVYVPEAGPSTQALLHRGSEVRDLVGQQFLYVVVFSERALPAAIRDKPQLTFSVRSIETRKDPFLAALVKALARQVAASVPQPDLPQGEDAAVALTLRDVRADTTSGSPLYVAMGRVTLGPNSLNRVTIAPREGFALDPQISLHNMFGNSDGSRFGTSLGAGFTMNARRPQIDDGELTGTSGYLRSSLYVFGQVYVDQPHQPVDPYSLGLAFGTNLLRGDLLDDLVLGLSIGRLNGVGIIVGANSLDWPVMDVGTSRVRHTRRWCPFLGLDLEL